MRNRILIALSGAVVGLAVAKPIADGFNLSSELAFAGCALVGLCLGYAGSILVDVFTAPTTE